jgi:hypothetical protein
MLVFTKCVLVVVAMPAVRKKNVSEEANKMPRKEFFSMPSLDSFSLLLRACISKHQMTFEGIHVGGQIRIFRDHTITGMATAMIEYRRKITISPPATPSKNENSIQRLFMTYT